MKETILMSAPALTRASDPYRLQSLDRAVAVLELIAESECPLSLADISHQMGVHKSTLHRALMVLEKSSLVERTGDARYRLGLRLYELGNCAVQQADLAARVRPMFRRLSAQVGETAHLGILQKSSVVYLDKAEPYRRVCSGSGTGSTNPVYCTSLGKAMLAYLPSQEAEKIIASLRFERHTEKTIDSREELLQSIERVRRRGYAIDDEEIEPGVRCIGAPIFDEHHRPIAAISLSGPLGRIRAQNVPALAAQLMRCCGEISAFLLSSRLQRAGSRPLLRHCNN